MKDSLLVGVADGVADVVHDLGGLACEDRPASEFVRKGLAADKLHAKERKAFVFAQFVNGDDVGMLQSQGGFGFGAKPFTINARGEFAFENHLDRDRFAIGFAGGLVDDPHAAATDFLLQGVVVQFVRQVQSGQLLFDFVGQFLALLFAGGFGDNDDAPQFAEVFGILGVLIEDGFQ